MMRRPGTRAVQRKESGFALLVIIFLATLMLLATLVVAPNVFTEGKREQEKEMIWRGKQYVRGVKLYYRKMGRFPTSLDDLTKPKIGTLRFMRQAYKDPMNKQDGTWRLIYVGPSGQLIGSLKPRPLNFQLPQQGGIGTPAPAALQPGSISSTSTGPQTSGGTAPVSGQPDSGTTPPTAPGTTTTGSGTTGAPVGTDQTASGTTGQPAPFSDTSDIIGGNIIGVGSKVDKASVIYYDTAKNYHLFEFIWDPSKDLTTIGGQSGLPTGPPPSQSLFGQPAQNPTNPQQNTPQGAPQTPQQPQTAPPQNPQQ